jgi:hypothetical protein
MLNGNDWQFKIKVKIHLKKEYRRVPFCGMSAVEELRILLK